MFGWLRARAANDRTSSITACTSYIDQHDITKQPLSGFVNGRSPIRRQRLASPARSELLMLDASNEVYARCPWAVPGPKPCPERKRHETELAFRPPARTRRGRGVWRKRLGDTTIRADERSPGARNERLTWDHPASLWSGRRHGADHGGPGRLLGLALPFGRRHHRRETGLAHGLLSGWPQVRDHDLQCGAGVHRATRRSR